MARNRNAATIQGPGPNPGDGYPIDTNPAPGAVFDLRSGSTTPADGRSATFISWVSSLLVPITHIVNNWLFNGTTWDRSRNNVELTLLASAARTANTNTGTQTNHNGRGTTLFLNVTVAPGGGETLFLELQFRDPVSAAFATVFSTVLISTTGIYVFQLYPAASGATSSSPLALCRQWLVRVRHSSSGPSWTYSLGACITN